MGKWLGGWWEEGGGGSGKMNGRVEWGLVGGWWEGGGRMVGG